MGCVGLTRWSFGIGLLLMVVAVLYKGFMWFSRASIQALAPRAILFAGAALLLIAIANEACAVANARKGQKSEK